MIAKLRVGWMVAGCAPAVRTSTRRVRFHCTTGLTDWACAERLTQRSVSVRHIFAIISVLSFPWRRESRREGRLTVAASMSGSWAARGEDRVTQGVFPVFKQGLVGFARVVSPHGAHSRAHSPPATRVGPRRGPGRVGPGHSGHPESPAPGATGPRALAAARGRVPRPALAGGTPWTSPCER